MKQSAQRLVSCNTNETEAVSELKSQLSLSNIAGMIFFCSSHYDLDSLGAALNSSFEFPVIGCTTAGEVSDGHYSHSIVALVFSSTAFAFHPIVLENLDKFESSKYLDVLTEMEGKYKKINPNNKQRFGFLLTDGLSQKEEKLTSFLNLHLGEIELFGGSAGDDLKFENTFIFYEGKFHTNIAVLLIITTENDFELFRHHHFIPTDKEIITTDVDVDKRLVKEINGEPAAQAYAEINGLDPENLSDDDFALHPLMLKVGDEWYIRSVGSVYDDGSLGFYCAIDEGLPLSVAEGKDMVKNLEDKVDELLENFEEVYFTLGCDCIFRRLEMEKNQLSSEIKDQLTRLKFIGFNSYGEQFDGLHLNQTLTAVVVGKKRRG